MITGTAIYCCLAILSCLILRIAHIKNLSVARASRNRYTTNLPGVTISVYVCLEDTKGVKEKEYMNDQKTAILIDSGCDIPARLRERYGIDVLPLRVIYPEKDYQDSIDINPTMIYQRYPDEIPTTSTPSLSEVTDKLDELKGKGYEKVIAFTISSNLSGTYNTVRLVASEYEDMEVFVFDTKNISSGSGLYAIWAAVRLQKGDSFEELCQKLPKKLGDSQVFFYMDTLQYLQRGGRIGKVAGTIGEALKIKPIISCDENGTYYTVAKIRGAKMGKLRLAEEVIRFSLGHKTWMLIKEGAAHEEALAMQELLECHEKLIDKQILSNDQIAATLALNTGPGLVGVAVLRDPE